MACAATKTAIVGLSAALLGFVFLATSPGRQIEYDIGLEALFKFRGTRKVPHGVAIISLSPIPGQITPWPSEPSKDLRAVHAQLTKKLSSLRAAVIAFDITFFEPGNVQDDRRFADAIRQAGNVILCEYVKSVYVPVSQNRHYLTLGVNIEKVMPPIPLLARSAAALAPFPLPKVPRKVAQYWTFKSIPQETATLPVATFEIFTSDLGGEFRRLLLTSLNSRIQKLETIAVSSPSLAYGRHPLEIYRGMLYHHRQWKATLLHALQSPRFTDLTLRQKCLLRSMVELGSTEKSRYLNFYGPPGTIPTFSYFQILEHGKSLKWHGRPFDLRGQAVFVGLSKLLRSEQKDGFYTVFSRHNGVDFSGVELAATAFANLVENVSVIPLLSGAQLMVVLATAALLALVCRVFSPLGSGAALLGASGIYFAVAYQQFKTAGIWMPLVTPMLIQAPFIWLATAFCKYFDTSRERNTIKKAFGYYLPDHAVAELARDLTPLNSKRKILYGTCLMTDAQHYTELSETLEPQVLCDFMNRYFETLFQPVKAHDGFISDVTGDAMLAIWMRAEPDPNARYQACLAALEIASAVKHFNSFSADRKLPTRIGLHSGRISLGNIGALDHYEYTPVGDVVNTASRIEGLNKHLKTSILVSNEVFGDLEGFLAREVGQFLLPGKSNPVTVHELVSSLEKASPQQIALCRMFAEIIAAFHGKHWMVALELAAKVLRIFPHDGPTLFYQKLCERYLHKSPGDAWNGIIRQKLK